MINSPLGFPVSPSVHLSPAPCFIRPAQISDLQQLAEVLASSFYPPLGWRRWVYPVLRFGIYEDLKQRLQTPQKHYQCLAAIAPGSPYDPEWVVGTVEISCRRHHLWVFSPPQQMYLSNLAVREGCRRRGVARKLLTASEQLALEWGFRELYLHVMADNRRARQLYQQMGYQVQQVETTLLSLVNARPQRLLMKKVVSPRQVSSPMSPLPPRPLSP